MSEGFKCNAAFFKLDFLDKKAVKLGDEFSALIPLLWLKAGGRGKCPKVDCGHDVEDCYIFNDNGFAILTDENAFNYFLSELEKAAGIHTIFLITDNNHAFKQMSLSISKIAALANARTIQLYRDYLENFRINPGGDI